MDDEFFIINLARIKLPIQLVSVHSTSKGFIGECGKRSGYMECYGLDDDVLAEVYKLASVGLCPNVDGQLTMSLMVAPPKPGDASYDTYTREVGDILGMPRLTRPF